MNRWLQRNMSVAAAMITRAHTTDVKIFSASVVGAQHPVVGISGAVAFDMPAAEMLLRALFVQCYSWPVYYVDASSNCATLVATSARVRHFPTLVSQQTDSPRHHIPKASCFRALFGLPYLTLGLKGGGSAALAVFTVQ